jgi:hypothetical protein
MAVNTITVDPPGQSSPLVLYGGKKPELGPQMCRVQNTQCVPQELKSGSEGCWGFLYLESGSLRHMRRHIPEERE